MTASKTPKKRKMRGGKLEIVNASTNQVESVDPAVWDKSQERLTAMGWKPVEEEDETVVAQVRQANEPATPATPGKS